MLEQKCLMARLLRYILVRFGVIFVHGRTNYYEALNDRHPRLGGVALKTINKFIVTSVYFF